MEKPNRKDSGRHRYAAVILGGALGVALLLFGSLYQKNEPTSDDADTSATFTADAEAYASLLETRITEICSGIGGVGEVEVMISLKGGFRTVYAIDSQSGTSGYRSEVVMSGSGSDKRAVVTAYENPEIAGVGIVCSGNVNGDTRASIVSLVSAALDVGANKIFVVSSCK